MSEASSQEIFKRVCLYKLLSVSQLNIAAVESDVCTDIGEVAPEPVSYP